MNGERIFATAISIVAAIALAASLNMPLLVNGVPGPGLMPAVASVILLLLSLTQIFPINKKKATDIPKSDGTKGGLIREFWLIVFCSLYIVVINTAGYIPAVFILTAGILMLIYKQGFIITVIGSTLISTISFVLFGIILGVQLPAAFLIIW